MLGMELILMESETQIGKHGKLICSKIKYLLLNSTLHRPVYSSYLKFWTSKNSGYILDNLSDFSKTLPFHSLSTY